jgi:hypothetical protein
MPGLRIYNLFISHVWDYREAYDRLVDLLDKARNFRWKNFSVPEHDPLSMRGLAQGLDRQLRLVHAVIAISGVYATNSDWMLRELAMADDYRKPIIAVAPRGNERISRAVQEYAVEVVNWNTDSIVGAVRRHTR